MGFGTPTGIDLSFEEAGPDATTLINGRPVTLPWMSIGYEVPGHPNCNDGDGICCICQ